MRGFVLVTSHVPGTAYDDCVKLTHPRMSAYADKWEMEFLPYEPSVAELDYFSNNGAPRGTGADYASIPWQIAAMDRGAKGVVFIDSDVLILSDEFDICREVTDNVPISAVVQELSEDPESRFPNWGVVVGRGPAYRSFLQAQWDAREIYRTHPWLEQAAAMELIGYDACHPKCKWLGPGAFTGAFGSLSPRWNWGPRSIPLPTTSDPRYNEPLFFHPTGLRMAEKMELLSRHTKETEHTWQTK